MNKKNNFSSIEVVFFLVGIIKYSTYRYKPKIYKIIFDYFKVKKIKKY